MTVEETAFKLGIAPYTLVNHFQRTVKKFAVRGIHIIKTGRGSTADYTIEYEDFNEYQARKFEETFEDIYIEEEEEEFEDTWIEPED